MAAGSLLIDYVLTVAVSIAAGVAAITSALPNWHINRVEMALAFVVVLMLGNLRGIRESGRIFSAPTYFFIGSLLMLIVVGAWRAMYGAVQPVEAAAPLHPITQPLTLFLLLTAFSSGCTAMTGVEAVSNGVPAFKSPEPQNAAATMLMMAVLSITMFVGITLLAQAYHVIPSEQATVVSQVARGVFGGRGLPYYLVQAATMLILVLAANTAYADFPRLASILARDRYLPRQLMNQGDRLAFSNGIVGLSVFAGVLLVLFGGDTHALMPLYMIGVFVSFTLSQGGMVMHWRRLRGRTWKTSAAINGFGALVTGLVLIVVAVTKAHEGAWIILLLIPLHVLFFRVTKHHYERVASQLVLSGWKDSQASRRHNTVLVPISGVHRAVVQALEYARTISSDVRAVYINGNSMITERVQSDWNHWEPDVPPIVLDSPYRSLLEPLMEYIERVGAANAQIGVASAAFFPTVTLGGDVGFQATRVAQWLSWPTRFWSVGPELALTLFDGGARRAAKAGAVANYDAMVAAYRQTVLAAFQDVEDNLAAERILRDEAERQQAAVAAAQRSLDISLNQYRAGTVNNLQVATQQTALLTNQRAALAVTARQFVAAVQLVAALGGGWNGDLR